MIVFSTFIIIDCSKVELDMIHFTGPIMRQFVRMTMTEQRTLPLPAAISELLSTEIIVVPFHQSMMYHLLRASVLVYGKTKTR